MSPQKVDAKSVVIACARITTVASSPLARANSALHKIAAAAPQVGGQHCSRVSGPKIDGDANTSSTVTGSRNTAYGLLAACLRALTATCANTAGSMPYLSAYAIPAAPKYCAAIGAASSHP